MNKHIVTFLLITVFSTNQAQAQFAFGATAGLNYSNIWGGRAFPRNPSAKFGFQFGATANYSFSERLSVEPKLLFSAQGFKSHQTFTDMTGGDKIKIRKTENPYYIQMPVHLRYKLGGFGGRLSIHAGPYVGFAVGGYVKDEWFQDGKRMNKTKEKISYDEICRRCAPIPMATYSRAFDAGLGCGVSVNFNNIQVGFAGNAGLVGVSQRDVVFEYSEIFTYNSNSCLSLTVTYMFGKMN